MVRWAAPEIKPSLSGKDCQSGIRSPTDTHHRAALGRQLPHENQGGFPPAAVSRLKTTCAQRALPGRENSPAPVLRAEDRPDCCVGRLGGRRLRQCHSFAAFSGGQPVQGDQARSIAEEPHAAVGHCEQAELEKLFISEPLREQEAAPQVSKDLDEGLEMELGE